MLHLEDFQAFHSFYIRLLSDKPLSTVHIFGIMAILQMNKHVILGVFKNELFE
jgi:hypothetical protein